MLTYKRKVQYMNHGADNLTNIYSQHNMANDSQNNNYPAV